MFGCAQERRKRIESEYMEREKKKQTHTRRKMNKKHMMDCGEMCSVSVQLFNITFAHYILLSYSQTNQNIDTRDGNNFPSPNVQCSMLNAQSFI